MQNRVAVFASGTGTNTERLIEYFQEHSSIEISLVLSNNPEAGVLGRAAKWNVPTLVFDREDFKKSDRVLDTLKKKGINWIALAGFLWLLPSKMVGQYSDKIVNIHPSLLPKYGGKGMYGSRVHEAVIAAKESQSGITIHLVNEEYDKGRIVFQKTCEVLSDETPDSLAAKIHTLEYRYFPPVMEALIMGTALPE